VSEPTLGKILTARGNDRKNGRKKKNSMSRAEEQNSKITGREAGMN
jgi:hypothetical protein